MRAWQASSFSCQWSGPAVAQATETWNAPLTHLDTPGAADTLDDRIGSSRQLCVIPHSQMGTSAGLGMPAGLGMHISIMKHASSDPSGERRSLCIRDGRHGEGWREWQTWWSGQLACYAAPAVPTTTPENVITAAPRSRCRLHGRCRQAPCGCCMVVIRQEVILKAYCVCVVRFFFLSEPELGRYRDRQLVVCKRVPYTAACRSARTHAALHALSTVTTVCVDPGAGATASSCNLVLH